MSRRGAWGVAFGLFALSLCAFATYEGWRFLCLNALRRNPRLLTSERVLFVEEFLHTTEGKAELARILHELLVREFADHPVTLHVQRVGAADLVCVADGNQRREIIVDATVKINRLWTLARTFIWEPVEFGSDPVRVFATSGENELRFWCR